MPSFAPSTPARSQLSREARDPVCGSCWWAWRLMASPYTADHQCRVTAAVRYFELPRPAEIPDDTNYPTNWGAGGRGPRRDRGSSPAGAPRRCLERDRQAVPHVDHRDRTDEVREFALVEVGTGLGVDLVGHTVITEAGGRVGERERARSRSVYSGVSCHAPSPNRRAADSPAASASALCMSMQNAHWLMSEARSFTSS